MEILVYAALFAAGLIILINLTRRPKIGPRWFIKLGTGKKGPDATVIGPLHCPRCKDVIYIDSDYLKRSRLIICPYCGVLLKIPEINFHEINPDQCS
jgi:hypothetical protein